MTALHFLGPDGALTTFPKRYELDRLRPPHPRPYLDVFVFAACCAIERIWVFDLHYHPDGHEGILNALHMARVKNVRILSERISAGKDKVKLTSELHGALSAAWAVGESAGKKVAIQWSVEWHDRLDRHVYPYPHDRFVIVDDRVWHFGFAAGGSGRCLSAASGPWDAKEQRALEFFEEVWLTL